MLADTVPHTVLGKGMEIMALRLKNCVALDRSVVVIYAEVDDAAPDITPQEARQASSFVVEREGRAVELDDKLVVFHDNIPATSIRLAGLVPAGAERPLEPGDTLQVVVALHDRKELFTVTLGEGVAGREGDVPTRIDALTARMQEGMEDTGRGVRGVRDTLADGFERVSRHLEDGSARIDGQFERQRRSFDDLRTNMGTLGNALNTLAFQKAPGGARAEGSLALGDGSAVVGREIQEVLRWRPRTSDPSGFVRALEQSFERVDVSGTPDYVWHPRSYVVMTDLAGEITGAQASLYSRTKLAVDASAKLLDGLDPLTPAFDPEDFDATTAILKQRMHDIVGELGRPAGPRVARLDNVFEQLLGPHRPGVTAEDVGGRLGFLRDNFGFDSDHINTIDEDQNATNFRIIVDHLACLRDDWRNNRPYFDGRKRFLGTQVELLERLLGTVAEAADEVRHALDAVLLGSQEQRSLRIRFREHPPMLIDDLLHWVHSFGSDGGPTLARDGGRTAIEGELCDTAALLLALVEDAADRDVQHPDDERPPFGAKRRTSEASRFQAHDDEPWDDEEPRKAPTKGLPDEYFYPIVQTAFGQLCSHLATLRDEACRRRPERPERPKPDPKQSGGWKAQG